MTPRVFISYSHDSGEHKSWVEKLAVRLQDAGIEVVLDVWNARLGGDLTLFMERELRAADRVLCICSERYVEKAESGLGGVGYERMIVTAELVKHIDTIRFVPVLRQQSTPTRIPGFLSTRLHIDLSDERTFESEVDRLIKDILRVDVPDRPAVESPTGAEGRLERVLERAARLARDQDRAGWRALSRELRNTFVLNLREIREKYERDQKLKAEAAAEVAMALEPVLAQVVAGVQASYIDVQEQRAFIDAILHIPSWNRSGYVTLVSLPKVAIFIFQAVCGASNLIEGRLDVALDFAETPIIDPTHMPTMPLSRRHDLIGWIESLGGDCTKSWEFLERLYARLSLLQRLGDEAEFRAALSAYYLAMNVDELALFIKTEKDWKSLIGGELRLDVPITFVKYGTGIVTKAVLLIERSTSGKSIIWSRHGVSIASMVEAWPAWLGHCMAWVRNVFSTWLYWFDDLPFKRLIG